MKQAPSDFQIAGGLNMLFLLLLALVFWPLGRAAMTWHLFKGYLLFWAIIAVTMGALALIQRLLRVESDPPSNAYVLMNLVVSIFLQLGWCAFAAITITNFISNAPLWVMILLYTAGLVSSYLMFMVVSAFYQGSLYRMVNASLSLIGYVVFAIWPATAHFLYGCFFDLF